MTAGVVSSSGVAGGLGSLPSDTGVSSSGVVWRELSSEEDEGEYAAGAGASVGVTGGSGSLGFSVSAFVDSSTSAISTSSSVALSSSMVGDLACSSASFPAVCASSGFSVSWTVTGCETLPG